MNLKQEFKKFLGSPHAAEFSNACKRNKAKLLLSVLILAAGILIVGRYAEKDSTQYQAEILNESDAADNAAPSPHDGEYKTGYMAGEVKPNQGIFQAVTGMGISTAEALKVVNVLRYNVELVSISAGEKIWIKPTDDGAGILELIYEPNSVIAHKVTLNPATGEYVYSMTEKPTEYRYRLVEGTMEEGSSLDTMLLNSKVPPNLTGTVDGILQCKISFRTDAREGDKFKILFRERYYKNERISGAVMYASYRGKRTGFHEAFRYSEDDPQSSYNAHYTPDGEALIHSGLRYPLDKLHIVSPFGMRVHPVTGRREMHDGIDYRARPGTKVHAVAKGKVIVSAYDSLSGNKVAVRHTDGSSSWYLHLEKRLVKKGQQVKTRQVIGISGATGRVSGPHLHFAFKNARGRWINPLTKRMIAAPKLTGARLQRLLAEVKEIRQEIRNIEGDGTGAMDSISLLAN